MPYVVSASPDFTEGFPFALTLKEVVAAYAKSGFEYDISIDEMPFLLACSEDNPYTRATLDTKKQQIDTSNEPGEQLFTQWWIRSQDSWHGGAGVTYYEPRSDEGTKYRYASSVGIDPWTEGQISLLHSMTLPVESAGVTPVYCTSAVVSGADVAFLQVDGVVKRWTGTAATNYTVSTGGTPASRVAVCGALIVVGTTDGISSGTVGGTALTALWTVATGTVLVPWWVKGRIIASRGSALHELTLAGGALPAAIWTHPSTSWHWTSVVEAPTAILAAGYDNGYGYIYAFNLVDSGSGGTPTLGDAIQIAEFPPGEEVYSLATYLGTYVAIGTNKGVRIGILGSDSNGATLTYGPLVIETTYPVRDLTARDRFAYATIQAGINGKSGCARIDLSNEVESGRFAWAYDVSTQTTGVPHSIACLGTTNRVLIGVADEGIYQTSTTAYEATGYMRTGRIRFSTGENKSFHRIRVRTSCPDDSTCAIYSIVPEGSPVFVFSLSNTFDDNQDISLSIANTGYQYLSIQLTLNASTDLGDTPIVDSMTLKALPLTDAVRELQIPLMCFDVETDRKGTKVGVRNGAWSRLAALEQAESDNATVNIVDTTTGESFSGQITRVAFTRIKPPEGNRKNFGGLINLTVVQL